MAHKAPPLWPSSTAMSLPWLSPLPEIWSSYSSNTPGRISPTPCTHTATRGSFSQLFHLYFSNSTSNSGPFFKSGFFLPLPITFYFASLLLNFFQASIITWFYVVCLWVYFLSPLTECSTMRLGTVSCSHSYPQCLIPSKGSKLFLYERRDQCILSPTLTSPFPSSQSTVNGLWPLCLLHIRPSQASFPSPSAVSNLAPFPLLAQMSHVAPLQ